MARPVASLGDDTALNMTPMIDIVFQLVVFFMLTLDMSSKAYAPLTLPFARHGVPDVDDPADPAQSRKVVVNVLADGRVVVKGHTYPLTQDDAPGAMQRLRGLRDAFVLATQPDPEHPELRDADQHSRVPVHVHADRAALWRYVQWILATASAPPNRIHKVHFGVKQPHDEPHDEEGAQPK